MSALVELSLAVMKCELERRAWILGSLLRKEDRHTETVLFKGTENSIDWKQQSGQTLNSLKGPHKQWAALKTDLSFWYFRCVCVACVALRLAHPSGQVFAGPSGSDRSLAASGRTFPERGHTDSTGPWRDGQHHPQKTGTAQGRWKNLFFFLAPITVLLKLEMMCFLYRRCWRIWRDTDRHFNRFTETDQ